MNELIKVDNVAITMTSLELVDFINSQRKPGESELRHDNFMVKVPKVLGEAAPKFLGTDTYVSGKGAISTRNVYHFPKREACLMAMSYSYELQAKVFDRMTELEQKVKFQVPQTLPEALRLAADLAEKNARQAILIEEQKPSVEFVQKYAEAESTKCLGDVAKVLGHKPHAFSKRLAEDGVIFKRDGVWIPTQAHLDVGRFVVRVGVSSC